MFKSKNSKIGHDLFVYSHRVGKHEAPKSSKIYMGTKPGYNKITTDNNNNMKQEYTPPQEGYKISNRIIWVHPSKGRISKCNCMIKGVEQVTTMDALTTHHEVVNESIVQKI